MKSNVHLIYFYTEGGVHDNGSNLINQANEFLLLVTGKFASVQGCTPRSLIASNRDWINVFTDRTSWVENHSEYTENLRWNKEWAKVNFQAWKPKIVLDLLSSNRILDGDIVFYHDINTRKYPEYRIGIFKWNQYVKEKILDYDVLLFNDNNVDFRSDTKIELIDHFNLGNLTGHHVWSGALAVKKTSLGIDFCKEWDQVTSNIELVSPFTKGGGQNYYWNAVDQAAVSALYYSHSLKKTKVRINCVYLNNSRIIPPLKFPLLGRVISFFYRKIVSIRMLRGKAST
jgi:hypothetical protein